MESTLKAEDMVETIKSIYSKIAKFSDEIEVEITIEDESITVSIFPNPEDTGCIIGREGKNIRALRNILASYALVNDDKRKIFIEVDSDNREEVDSGYRDY